MAVTRSYKVGDEIPSLQKTMTQEAINLFEKSGGASGPSQFTDTETARHTLGTGSTVDLRFLRPVRPGDTVTFTGKITGMTKEANGQRVAVEVSATNQKGDTTAAGSGSCLVPSGYFPPEE